MSLSNVNQTDMNAISLVSWNVRGLGHATKQGKALAHLKSLKADIMFLQETHLKSTQQGLIRANWISQLDRAPFSSNFRGG